MAHDIDNNNANNYYFHFILFYMAIGYGPGNRRGIATRDIGALL